MDFTFESCMAICSSNENFYFSEHNVNNEYVVTFNYNSIDQGIFVDPLMLEMRGCSFIKDRDTYIRNRSLSKFFNVSEEDKIKDTDVVEVREKMDGSLIQFIKVGNSICAKTQNSFDNIQTRISMYLFNSDSKLRDLVVNSIDSGIHLFFELVGPSNQIVVSYNKNELCLIAARNESDGKYLDIDNFGYENVSKKCDLPFSKLIEMVETENVPHNFEGWIIHLKDGTIKKLKTRWYVALHRVVSNDFSENVVMEIVLNKGIDDLKQFISSDSTKMKYMLEVESVVQEKIKNATEEISGILENFDGNFKEFALQYNKNSYFHVMMNVLRKGYSLEKAVYEHFLKKTSKLADARSFVVNDLGVGLYEIYACGQ